MVDTPFQQPQALNVRQNRALALAGVFRARAVDPHDSDDRSTKYW